MLFSYVSLHLFLASTTSAALHHLFVGPLFTTPFLYSIEFDDELLTLKILKNQTVHAAHSFITFDVLLHLRPPYSWLLNKRIAYKTQYLWHIP
jgi:hypothetical protein